MIAPETIQSIIQGANDELVRLAAENKRLKKENEELKVKIDSLEVIISDLEARTGNLSNSLSIEEEK